MPAPPSSRLGMLTRVLLGVGIGVTVIALTATVSAGLSADVEGMRGAGVYIVSGLTFTAAGLVVYAVATHGVLFLRAVVDAGSIRRRPTRSPDGGAAPQEPFAASPGESESMLLGGFTLPLPPETSPSDARSDPSPSADDDPHMLEDHRHRADDGFTPDNDNDNDDRGSDGLRPTR
ncbi:hypothetical protein R2Q81_07185 [Microbacterium aquimaris]|uniref:hypothetical protein n=1 Tax=Microbacterium aquimaris TaxID=459816 RepID=UPI002AD3E886|nr:hypothetical protein [Microbacterium aquimaris]MDZ8275733.1 hypothetical protein [Microbacterium aquimaris]